MRKLAIAALFCLAFSVLLTAGQPPLVRAQAQTPQPSPQGLVVSARAGFGDTGAYLISEWLPVRVTLSNPAGGRTMRVRVSVSSMQTDDASVAGRYARDVDLPAPSRKEITLYAFSSTYTREFAVEVYEGDRLVTRTVAGAEPFEPPGNMIIGVVSSDASLLNSLQSERVGHIVGSLPPGGYGSYGGLRGYGVSYAPVSTPGGLAVIAHMTLSEVPPLAAGIESLGALVVDDAVGAVLSNEQISALEAWISGGGTLLVTHRPGGAALPDGLARLLPVTVSGSTDLPSITSLAEFAGVLAPSGPAASIAVGSATLRGDTNPRVIAMQDNVPLLVAREIGLGQVAYLGLSPALPPLKGWDGTTVVMRALLAEHPLRLTYGGFKRFNGSSRGYYIGSIYDTYGGIFAMPGLDLPSAWLVGLFLLVYILIVGPVNFIVLRRMRRAELAWITVPALVVVFSVAAYLLAYQSKGGELVTVRANVVSTSEGVSQAAVNRHFGLFSPVRRTYRLTVGADSLLTEMNSYGYYRAGTDDPAVVMGGPTTGVESVNINTWSLRGFLAEYSAAATSPLTASLHLADNRLEGTISNRSGQPLQDVALVRGDAVQYVGYMSPGQTANVRLELSASVFNNASPAALLPPPANVQPPPPGMQYPYTGGQGSDTAQRTYNRKVELLSAGLYPLVGDTPPADYRVIALAWGPDAPGSFAVEGRSSSTEEVTLWTSMFTPVSFPAAAQAERIKRGYVPYTVFAPGSDPVWQTWGGASAITAPTPRAVPTPAPTVAPGVSGTPSLAVVPPPVPSPLVVISGYVPAPSNIRLAPHADVRFRLPAGVVPRSLTFGYSATLQGGVGRVGLQAYDPRSGEWFDIGEDSPDPLLQGEIDLQDPSRFVGPGGDVLIRVAAVAGATDLEGAVFSLALNDTGAR